MSASVSGDPLAPCLFRTYFWLSFGMKVKVLSSLGVAPSVQRVYIFIYTLNFMGAYSHILQRYNRLESAPILESYLRYVEFDMKLHEPLVITHSVEMYAGQLVEDRRTKQNNNHVDR